MPRSCTRPCTPQPTIATDAGSSRARYFAATAVAAAVRWLVISIESMIARGVPLVRSARTMTPWMVGRPNRSRLPVKLPLILAAKYGAGVARPAAFTWNAPCSAWMPSIAGGSAVPSACWRNASSTTAMHSSRSRSAATSALVRISAGTARALRQRRWPTAPRRATATTR